MALEQISLDSVLIMVGDVAPTAGAGIAAPLGSTYTMTDGSNVYRKSGVADTAWTALGGGAGGGAGSFGITIDGGGSVITTGLKGYIQIPYNGTITRWDIVSDVSGSIVIDVWKDTYANFPPTIADTITGTEKPTLSAAVKNQDIALGTWITAVTANDWFAFSVDSVSTVTRVTLTIQITKT